MKRTYIAFLLFSAIILISSVGCKKSDNLVPNSYIDLPEQYINYTVGDTIVFFYTPRDEFLLSKSGDTATQINASIISDGVRTYTGIGFQGISMGNHQITSFYIYSPHPFTYSLYSPSTVTITEYGSSGTGYIAGSFTGIVKPDISFNSSQPVLKPITCVFRIKNQ